MHQSVSRRLKVLVAVSAVVGLPVLGASAAHARTTCYTVQYADRSQAEEVCSESVPDGITLNVPNKGVVILSSAPPPRITLTFVPNLAAAPACYFTQYVDVAVGAPPDAGLLITQASALGVAGLSPCPSKLPTFTTVDVAKGFAQSQALGVPKPQIQARMNVNGLPTCLTATTAAVFTPIEVQTYRGLLRIEGEAGILVDWGDHSSVQEYFSTGHVFPQCDVSHVFASKGKFDITASYVWHLKYWLNGVGPTPLADAQVAGVLRQVRVVDVQAVVG